MVAPLPLRQPPPVAAASAAAAATAMASASQSIAAACAEPIFDSPPPTRVRALSEPPSPAKPAGDERPET
eukprot:9456153-Alexandrium_andersonii.AAC.1